MKRKALGKGLSSLIPAAIVQRSTSQPQPQQPQPHTAQPQPLPAQTPTEVPAVAPAPRTGLREIDLDRIWPNRSQPRQQFDPATLEELAASLRTEGVLQPVVVRPAGGDTYELIAGERRWRAAQMAGLLRIPAVVREASDDHLLQLALIENLQREELSPLEEAHAFQTLIDDLGLSQQDVADRVGKQRATIANALRLLNLPKDVQDLVASGELSAGHAKALAGLTDSATQIELARRIVRDGLSVRAVESLLKRPTATVKRPRGRTEVRDPNVVAAEDRLQTAVGTRVRIVQNPGGSGRLELHFFSPEELERVFDIVLRGTRSRTP